MLADATAAPAAANCAKEFEPQLTSSSRS